MEYCRSARARAAVRAGDHAGQAHRADGMRQQQAVLGELRAQHVADALRRIGRQPLALRAVVVEQAERDVRMRASAMRSSRPQCRIRWLPSAGTCGAPAPRRTAGARPRWCRAGRGGADLLPPSICQACSPSRVREMMNARPRRWRPAPRRGRSHRRHRFQFGQRADLAGGVARQRRQRFLGRNAAAVVGHGDAANAATASRTSMARAPASIAFSSTSPRHGCRPLDDLAGRDLTDQQVGRR